MLLQCVQRAWSTGRVGLICLIATIAIAAGPNHSHAEDIGEGGGQSENSASSGGGNESSAEQGSESTGGVEQSGGNTSAEGTSQGGSEAESGKTAATSSTETTATAEKTEAGVTTAEATAVGNGTGEAGYKNKEAEAIATAKAQAGIPNPTATATTENPNGTTSATATYGQAPTAVASDPNGQIKTKQTSKKSVAFAMNPDGSYSLSVATKKGAKAESGVFDGTGPAARFAGKNLAAAANAAARAFAEATKTSAKANASASGSGYGAKRGTFSKADSASSAYARVGPVVKGNNVTFRSRAGDMTCRWWPQGQVLICPKTKG